MTHLNIPQHIAYHKRCLGLLPHQFQGVDLNRVSIAFFLLNALDILNSPSPSTFPEHDRLHWIDWLYKCQLTQGGGFRGSTATISGPPSLFDSGHLPASYFAIATLLILGDDLSRVKRTEILKGLRKSQFADGSFAPVLLGDGEKFGEVDVRHLYCAVAVREMLSPVTKEEDFDVSAAIGYIQRCKVYHLTGYTYA
jgi:geranylgeranyl transferase type-1 subunit beta